MLISSCLICPFQPQIHEEVYRGTDRTAGSEFSVDFTVGRNLLLRLHTDDRHHVTSPPFLISPSGEAIHSAEFDYSSFTWALRVPEAEVRDFVICRVLCNGVCVPFLKVAWRHLSFCAWKVVLTLNMKSLEVFLTSFLGVNRQDKIRMSTDFCIYRRVDGSGKWASQAQARTLWESRWRHSHVIQMSIPSLQGLG